MNDKAYFAEAETISEELIKQFDEMEIRKKLIAVYEEIDRDANATPNYKNRTKKVITRVAARLGVFIDEHIKKAYSISYGLFTLLQPIQCLLFRQ